MEESILNSVKKMLGIFEDDESFDTDIIIHINSALNVLKQLGVGPKTGWSITGKAEKWGDFLVNEQRLDMAKTYVYLKVRTVFDPPTNSSILTAMTQQISELEWRLNVDAESDWNLLA